MNSEKRKRGDGDSDSDEGNSDVMENEDLTEPTTRTMKLLQEKTGKLALHKNLLAKLLNPTLLVNMPIAVVSIAGAFRMGKSFMLNLCLHYLRKKGWEDKSGSWLNDWDSTKDKGIEWKGGSRGHTEGIVAWAQPIIVARTDGSKLAVILLDTQGNFDHGQNKEKNVGVFALSTLFSSLQIFNVSNQIQANDLEYLQCFVEFAKLYSPKESDVDSGHRGTERRLFQNLLFLVRDWQNPKEHSYGYLGGDTYLKELSQASEDGVFGYLNRAFNPPRCYLMPQPADCVRLGENSITGSNMGHEFRQHVVSFMNEFLHPDKLDPKCIGIGVEATASDICIYVERCADEILSGEQPDFPNLMQLVAFHSNQIEIDKAKEAFKTGVEKKIEKENPTWKEFDDLVKSMKKAAKSDFLQKRIFGIGNEQRLRIKKTLKKCFADIYPSLEIKMAEQRRLYVESRIQKLIEEASAALKKRRLPFTNIKDLEKTRSKYEEKAKKELDKRDSRAVAEIVTDAVNKISELFEENFCKAKNNDRTIFNGVGVAATVVTATTVTGLSTLVGSFTLALVGGPVILVGGAIAIILGNLMF